MFENEFILIFLVRHQSVLEFDPLTLGYPNIREEVFILEYSYYNLLILSFIQILYLHICLLVVTFTVCASYVTSTIICICFYLSI